jgi:hypothetical protein
VTAVVAFVAFGIVDFGVLAFGVVDAVAAVDSAMHVVSVRPIFVSFPSLSIPPSVRHR